MYPAPTSPLVAPHPTPNISPHLLFGSFGMTLSPPPFTRHIGENRVDPSRRLVRDVASGGAPIVELEEKTCFKRKHVLGMRPHFEAEVIQCRPSGAKPAQPVKTEVKMCVSEEYYPPGYNGNRFTEKVTVVEPCKDVSFCTIL